MSTCSDDSDDAATSGDMEFDDDEELVDAADAVTDGAMDFEESDDEDDQRAMVMQESTRDESGNITTDSSESINESLLAEIQTLKQQVADLKRQQQQQKQQIALTKMLHPPDSTAKKALNTYVNLGSKLCDANDASLTQLQRFIANGRRHADTPYVLLDGSSGVGKTQVAFTFNHTYKVLYFVFVKAMDSIQPIYKPFTAATTLLISALQRDQSEIGDHFDSMGTIRQIANELWICCVIDYFLDQTGPILTCRESEVKVSFSTQKKITIAQLRARVSKLEYTPIAFMDEVYYTDPNANSMSGNQMKYAGTIRDVFRAVGIIPILTGTNSTIGSHSNEEGSRPADLDDATFPHVLILVRPVSIKLNFLYECITGIPLEKLLQNWLEPQKQIFSISLEKGRPLFSKILIQELVKVHASPSKPSFSLLIQKCCSTLDSLKPQAFSSPAGLRAQLCLFLPSHRSYRFKVAAGTTMINSHFANVHGENRKLLWSGDNWFDFDTKDKWVAHCSFPNIEDEPLLYYFLCCRENVFGKLKNGTFRTTSRAFNEHLSKVLDSSTIKVDNPSASKNSGEEFEALAMAAICVASNRSGLRNRAWSRFLANLLCEVSMDFCHLTDAVAPPEISKFFRRGPRFVPFIFPACDGKEGNTVPQLDRVWRPADADQYDICTSFWLSGECKSHESAVGAKLMYENLKRVPIESQVHLVFVRKLGARLFRRKDNAWYDKVDAGIANKLSMLQLKKSQDNGCELQYLADEYDKSTKFGVPRPSRPTTVVIYIEVPYQHVEVSRKRKALTHG